MKCPSWVAGLLHYSSVRYVLVNDARLGLIFRSLQLLVIGYVVGYSIIAQQAYQKYDPVHGTATIKIKGSGFKNTTAKGLQVYDTEDLVVPPTMQGAFFVTTRFHGWEQSRDGICSASPDNTTTSGRKCNADPGCVNGEATFLGVMDGTCGEYNNCNIRAWCPLENDPDSAPENEIHGVRNFSIFIRLNTAFTKFGVTLSTGKNPVDGLSLFSLREITDRACDGDCSFEDIRGNGGVVLANAIFDCDANQDLNVDNCQPDWEFSRIDEGAGFNFRTVFYNSTLQGERLLKKLYGVRTVIVITGQAGKYDTVALLIALGSGLGLLGLASAIADFLLQNCWPKREKFLHDKYTEVDLEGKEGLLEAMMYDDEKSVATQEDGSFKLRDTRIVEGRVLGEAKARRKGGKALVNPLLDALEKKNEGSNSARSMSEDSSRSENTRKSSVGAPLPDYQPAGFGDYS